MQSDKYRVLVAHPGTQHSRQTALALQKAGMLQNYVTCFYYKKHSVLENFLRLLPFGFGDRLERQLLRRRSNELDQDVVLTFPLPELIYISSERFALTRKWSGHVLRWRNRRFDQRVAKLVRKTRPDAVICYDSCALKTFEACRQTGTLAILDQSACLLGDALKILRDEAMRHAENQDVIQAPEWLVDQCRQEALMADKVLVASEFVRDSLIESGVPSDRIAMLRYGVDVDRFHPHLGRREGKFRVLYAGHLSRGKGVRYLLEAFSALELRDAELLMVGSVAGADDILDRYHGIFRHVLQVPHVDMPAYFQEADLFVFPSLMEGMGLVVLEAMASGLPVITTQHAACIVRDGIDGFIVPIRDVATLKERIRLLYQDRELRKSMGKQARLQAQNYTWDAYHQRLGMLLRQFLGGKAS